MERIEKLIISLVLILPLTVCIFGYTVFQNRYSKIDESVEILSGLFSTLETYNIQYFNFDNDCLMVEYDDTQLMGEHCPEHWLNDGYSKIPNGEDIVLATLRDEIKAIDMLESIYIVESILFDEEGAMLFAVFELGVGDFYGYQLVYSQIEDEPLPTYRQCSESRQKVQSHWYFHTCNPL